MAPRTLNALVRVRAEMYDASEEGKDKQKGSPPKLSYIDRIL